MMMHIICMILDVLYAFMFVMMCMIIYDDDLFSLMLSYVRYMYGWICNVIILFTCMFMRCLNISMQLVFKCIFYYDDDVQLVHA